MVERSAAEKPPGMIVRFVRWLALFAALLSIPLGYAFFQQRTDALLLIGAPERTMSVADFAANPPAPGALVVVEGVRVTPGAGMLHLPDGAQTGWWAVSDAQERLRPERGKPTPLVLVDGGVPNTFVRYELHEMTRIVGHAWPQSAVLGSGAGSSNTGAPSAAPHAGWVIVETARQHTSELLGMFLRVAGWSVVFCLIFAATPAGRCAARDDEEEDGSRASDEAGSSDTVFWVYFWVVFAGLFGASVYFNHAGHPPGVRDAGSLGLWGTVQDFGTVVLLWLGGYYAVFRPLRALCRGGRGVEDRPFGSELLEGRTPATEARPSDTRECGKAPSRGAARAVALLCVLCGLLIGFTELQYRAGGRLFTESSYTEISMSDLLARPPAPGTRVEVIGAQCVVRADRSPGGSREPLVCVLRPSGSPVRSGNEVPLVGESEARGEINDGRLSRRGRSYYGVVARNADLFDGAPDAHAGRVEEVDFENGVALLADLTDGDHWRDRQAEVFMLLFAGIVGVLMSGAEPRSKPRGYFSRDWFGLPLTKRDEETKGDSDG